MAFRPQAVHKNPQILAITMNAANIVV